MWLWIYRTNIERMFSSLFGFEYTDGLIDPSSTQMALDVNKNFI